MAYDEEIYRKIADEYDRIRSVCENERQARIDEVYRRFPRISEIKNEINMAGAENVRRIFSDPSKKDYYNAILKNRINALENEKREILEKNGISMDFDRPIYRCSLCGDTGYIDGKKCRCFEQKLINAMYSVSNIEKILREQNFDTFSFRYFSNVCGVNGISELEKMKKIHTECVRFCDEFEKPGKSLLFHGGTGTGKTFLSSCIAKRLIDSGKTVVYIRAAQLFSMYEDYRFGRSDDMRLMFDRIYKADLLIIDDLGAEMKNKNAFSFFLELMNERMQSGKKMIISTNFTMPELTESYSSRFSSRIYEYFNPLHFTGEDIRLKKLMN